MLYVPAALRLQSENWTIPYDSTPEQVVEKMPGPGTTFSVTEERSLVTMLFALSSTATSGCGFTAVPTEPPVGGL